MRHGKPHNLLFSMLAWFSCHYLLYFSKDRGVPLWRPHWICECLSSYQKPVGWIRETGKRHLLSNEEWCHGSSWQYLGPLVQRDLLQMLQGTISWEDVCCCWSTTPLSCTEAHGVVTCMGTHGHTWAPTAGQALRLLCKGRGELQRVSKRRRDKLRVLHWELTWQTQIYFPMRS